MLLSACGTHTEKADLGALAVAKPSNTERYILNTTMCYLNSHFKNDQNISRLAGMVIKFRYPNGANDKEKEEIINTVRIYTYNYLKALHQSDAVIKEKLTFDRSEINGVLNDITFENFNCQKTPPYSKINIKGDGHNCSCFFPYCP